jgi:N-acetylmuramoyl-L-alanine amidase
MPLPLKRSVPLLIVLALAGLALFLLRRTPPPSAPPSAPVPAESTGLSPALSVLAEMPDWSTLNEFQNTITRADFERLLTTVFTTGGAWRSYIEIDETEARILTGSGGDDGVFHLRFAAEGLAAPVPRDWRAASELPPAPPGKPLDGLHIAIDPGHIGGEWAKVEERWLVVGNGSPVCEGDMTLKVANLLKPQLEALGARVSLVRDKPEPVTPLRPESLVELAKETGGPADSPAALRKFAERLFYRTAEIRARAQLVNDTLKPDFVLCLHFNADPWGNPSAPTLVDRSHLHLLLNGAYTDEEVGLADQRFALLEKLLRRTHEEEAKVGTTVANIFAEASGLPPYIYPAGSLNALTVNGHPYLWARNLLANRLYDCPVIFMEPYVMNSTIDHPRIQAGDYEGLREVNGKKQVSIFREYADAMAKALETHYTTYRKAAP